jgi:hypothetical protein
MVERWVDIVSWIMLVIHYTGLIAVNTAIIWVGMPFMKEHMSSLFMSAPLIGEAMAFIACAYAMAMVSMATNAELRAFRGILEREVK